ncbi:alpha-L-fucosidase, partial [candidate division KSB1 bacterium]|nr:alpha-L-fucosidase [candidate division KSB1 bacterium]
DLSEACREFGLKMGIYISPWDRHEPSYGDSPKYDEHFKNQLREVLTNYGEIFEVWFDGACGEGPNGKRQVYDWEGFIQVVRECQPNAVIFSDGGPDVRWVGNENGFAGETNWCLLRRDEVYPGYPNYHELTSGHANGTHWVPAECDVSIRPGWYYHQNQDNQVKSLTELMEIYYKSIGRNANLLLNLPVDRRGLVHENDVQRLMEFKNAIDLNFAVNLAKGKTATASQFRGNDAKFSPQHSIDEDKNSYWTIDNDVLKASLEINLGESTKFNRVMIQEYIALGQRIESFSIEAWDGENWNKISEGTTIGYKRLLRLPSVVARKIRLNILKSRACPIISNFEIFNAPDF